MPARVLRGDRRERLLARVAGHAPGGLGGQHRTAPREHPGAVVEPVDRDLRLALAASVRAFGTT